MDDLDQNQMTEISLDQRQSTWTIAQVEIPSWLEIEELKSNFFRDLYNLSIQRAQIRLSGILSYMQVAMERQFTKEEIRKYCYKDQDGVKNTFYDFKARVTEGFYDDYDEFEFVAEVTFDQYNHFIKRRGGGVPTEISDPKKKFSNAFSGRRI